MKYGFSSFLREEGMINMESIPVFVNKVGEGG